MFGAGSWKLGLGVLWDIGAFPRGAQLLLCFKAESEGGRTLVLHERGWCTAEPGVQACGHRAVQR